MSDPRTDYRDTPQGIVTELISAMSALNMEPSPLPPDEIKHDTGYLSDTDMWVRHAMEHLHAAYGLAQKTSRVYYLLEVLMSTHGVEMKPSVESGDEAALPMKYSHDEIFAFLANQYQEARTRLTLQSRAHDVVEMARQRKEIGPGDDGYQYYWPTVVVELAGGDLGACSASGEKRIVSGGAMSAEELRALADELDRLNAGWDKELKSMEASGK